MEGDRTDQDTIAGSMADDITDQQGASRRVRQKQRTKAAPPGPDTEVTEISSDDETEPAPATVPVVKIEPGSDAPGVSKASTELELLNAQKEKLRLEIRLLELQQQQAPRQQQQPLPPLPPSASAAALQRAAPPPRAPGAAHSSSSGARVLPPGAVGGVKRNHRTSFAGYMEGAGGPPAVAMHRARSAPELVVGEKTIAEVLRHHRTAAQQRRSHLDMAYIPSMPVHALVTQYVLERRPDNVVQPLYCYSCRSTITKGAAMFGVLGDYVAPGVPQRRSSQGGGGMGVVPFCSPLCILHVPEQSSSLVDRSIYGGLPLPRGMATNAATAWDKDRVVLSSTLRGELAAHRQGGAGVSNKFLKQMSKWAEYELPEEIQQILGGHVASGESGDDDEY